MVTKRYVKKGEKEFGPYYYESYRDKNGKVRKRYIKDYKPQKNNTKAIIIGIIIILLLVLAGIIALVQPNQSPITGKASTKYAAGDTIDGTISLNLREGECMPANSLVRISYDGSRTEFNLNDHVDYEVVDADFYTEGSEISGHGECFGIAGTVTPTIKFKLKLSDGSQEESSDDTEETESPSEQNVAPEEPVQSPDEVIEEQPQEQIDNAKTNGQEKAPAEESAVPSKESETLSPSITGSVISESNVIIEGEVSDGRPFTYNLALGQTAEIVSGSVRIDGEEVSENLISLDFAEDEVVVTTDYQIEGFGERFVSGDDSALMFEIPISALGLKADPLSPAMNIQVSFNDVEIVSYSQEIEVTEEGETLLEPAEPQIPETSLILVEKIPPVSIREGDSSTIDISQYIQGAESYAIELQDITSELNAHILTLTPDKGFIGARKAKLTARSGEQSLTTSISILVSSEGIRLTTTKQKIEVGKPVFIQTEVTKLSSDEVKLQIPDVADNIEVHKKVGEDLIEEEVKTANVRTSAITGQVVVKVKLDKPPVLSRLKEKLKDLFGLEEVQPSLSGRAITEDKADAIDLTLEAGETGEEETLIVSYELPAPALKQEPLTNGGERFEISSPDFEGSEEVYTDVVVEAYLTQPIDIDDLSKYKMYWLKPVEDKTSGEEIKSVDEVPETEVIEDISSESNMEDTQTEESQQEADNKITGKSILTVRVISDSLEEEAQEKTERVGLEFVPACLDENGLVTCIQWVVPHLSNQTFEFVIEISEAVHLDEDREFISDIYDETFALDNVWSEAIPENHYIRVSFEQNLTSDKDITLFPRTVSGAPRVEVYGVNSTDLIASFDSLNDNQYNKVYLSNLVGEQDTFDLLVVGGSIELDHIIDPSDGAPNVAFTTGSAEAGTQANRDIFVGLDSADMSTHYAFTDFNRDLLLWLRMDNAAGGGVTDFSSYATNGILSGNAKTNSTGYWGNASHFDGNLDVINVSSSRFNITGPMTVSLWAKANSVEQYDGLVMWNYDGGWTDGWGVWLSSTTKVCYFFGVYSENYACKSGDTLTNWNHIVGVFNGTNMTIYVNGVQGNVKGASFVNKNARSLFIGSATYETGMSGPGYDFNGSIDELLIWNRSLTQAEILSLYNASMNQYARNFTNLNNGTYTFTGYVADTTGLVNQTSQRSVIVNTSYVSSGGRFIAPSLVAITQNYVVNGTVDGNLTNGTTYSTDQEVVFRKVSDGRKVKFTALFSMEDVDLSALSITTTARKTVVDASAVSGVQSTHSIYIPAHIGSAVYVCPNALTLEEVTSSCSGVVWFSYNEIVAGTTKSGLTASLNGEDVEIAGLTGSGGSGDDVAPQIDFSSSTASSGAQANRDIFVGLDTADNSSHYAFADFNNDVVLWMTMDDTTNLTYADNTEDAAALAGSCLVDGESPTNEAYDENWNTRISDEGGCTVLVNYTIPARAKSAVNEIKTALHYDTYITYAYCYNYDTGQNVPYAATIDEGIANWSIPLGCLAGDVLRINVTLGGTGGVPAFYEEQIWWTVADELIDLSFYGNDGTAQGDAAQNSSGKFGDSFNFDGTNDLINISDSDSLTFNRAGTYTWSFWINRRSTFTGIMGKYAGDCSGDAGYSIYFGDDPVVSFKECNGTSYTYSDFLDTNTWYHVAITYNNTNATIYLNGYVNSSALFPSIVSDSNSPFTVGYSAGGEVPEYLGQMDELLIFNRSLTLAEIRALYDASATQYSHNFTGLVAGTYNFTGHAVDAAGNMNQTSERSVTITTLDIIAPAIEFGEATTDSGTQEDTNIFVGLDTSDLSAHYTFADFNEDVVLWMRFEENGTYNDSSSYGYGGDDNGTSPTWQDGIFGGSYLFEKNDTILVSNLSNGARIDEDGNFMLSAWIKTTDDNAGTIISDYFYFEGEGLFMDEAYGWVFSISDGAFDGGGQIQYSTFNGSTVTQLNNDGYDAADGEWNHVLLSIQGTNTSIYVNGAYILSQINDVPGTNALREFRIGNRSSGSGFNGSIDEVMVFNRALTSTEVSALYNASATQYSRNFTNLGYGTYNFTGYAVDAAGNVNQTSERTVTVDDPSTIELTACGTLNITSGNYRLMNNVSSNGTCFTIGAANVTLDGQGFTVNYSKTTAGYGINNSGGFDYLNVSDLNIVQGGTSQDSEGIYLENVNYALITSVDINVVGANSEGIELYLSHNNTLNNLSVVTSGNGAAGIWLSASDYNALSNLTLSTSDDTAYGIAFSNSDSNTLTSVIITTSGLAARGIQVSESSYNIISSSIITTAGDESIGIMLDTTNSNFVTAPTVRTYGADSPGIRIVESTNESVNNLVIITSGNYGYGVHLDRSLNSTVTNSNVNTSGNSAYAFHLYYSNNSRIEWSTINTSSNFDASGFHIDHSFDNNISYVGINTLRGYGANLVSSGRNNLTNLTIHTTGTSSAMGIYLSGSDFNSFENSIITTVGTSSPAIYFSLSNNNNIYNSLISTSGISSSGIDFPSSSMYNTIINSHINTSNSNSRGISLRSGSSYNNVTGGIINTSLADSIYLGDTFPGAITPVKNRIENITLQDTYQNHLKVATSAFTSSPFEVEFVNMPNIGNYSLGSVGGLLTVRDSEFGEIKFLQNVTGNGTNFTNDIRIGDNFAVVESGANAGLNKSANITLYGIGNRGFADPVILRDGALCTNCYNFTSLTSENVTFNVTAWTNYSIGGEPDTSAPSISFAAGTPNDGTKKYGDSFFVNVSVTNAEDQDRIVFTLRNANLTLLNASSYTTPVREIIFVGLSPGSYYYDVTINDTAGNTDSTETRLIRLIGSCFNSQCTEGLACAITPNSTCVLNHNICSGGVCDFTELVVGTDATIWSGYDANGNGNNLVLNVTSNDTRAPIIFNPNSTIDLSGENGTDIGSLGEGGDGGILNITVPDLFNTTNARFYSTGGYTPKVGSFAGGNGGIVQLNYHGLIRKFTDAEEFAEDNTPRLSPGVSVGGVLGIQFNSGIPVYIKDLTRLPRDADVNDDGYVDIQDLIPLASNYNKRASQTGYSSARDITGDGIINVIDFSKIGISYGRGI